MNTLSNEELIEIISGVVDGVQPTTQEMVMARELLELRKERETAVPVEPAWKATKYPVSRPVPGAKLIVWDETGKFVGYGSAVDTRESGVAIQMSDGRRLDSNHVLRWQYALQPAPPAQAVAVPDEMLAAMEEVLRISDRDHEAWHRARDGIAFCRAAMLKQPASIQASNGEGASDEIKQPASKEGQS